MKKRCIIISLILMLCGCSGAVTDPDSETGIATDTTTTVSELQSETATSNVTAITTTTTKITTTAETTVTTTETEPTYSQGYDWYGVTAEMLTPKFWAERDGKILETPEEIAEYNKELTGIDGTDVVEIKDCEKTIDGSKLKSMIEKYIIDCDFVNGNPITWEQKQNYLASRNLDAIPQTVTAKYGIITNETNLRSFPTNDILMYKADIWDFDYFQESALSTGEPVIIYHESADGKWKFIRSRNYSGWVSADDIGECDKADMESFAYGKDFITVTNDYIDENDVMLKMGVHLPLRNGKILMPASNGGKLETRETEIPGKLEYCNGYLPYTEYNIVNQSIKMLGDKYSWSSKDRNDDCSSTLLAVYECFGFHLPRNTSSMFSMNGTDFTGMGELAKNEKLAEMGAGTLLLTKGHVMMYLGEVDGESYMLHNFTSCYDRNGTFHKVNQCAITPTSITKKGGQSYLSLITKAVRP